MGKQLPTGRDESPVLWFGATTPGNSTAARYLPQGGLRTTIISTEATGQALMTRPGTFRRLWVKYQVAGAQDAVFTLRINGGNTGLTVTILAGSTVAVADLTHTADYVAGDLVSLQSVTGTGDATTTNTIAGVEY